jgi:hypothetical protein
VPARFIDDSGFKLGGWVNKQRQDFDSLERDKRERLAALPDWSMNPFKELWDQGYEATALFANEHGHCNVPPKKIFTVSGNNLNTWINRQRTKSSVLTEEQRHKLEKLPGWVWDPKETGWQEMFTCLQEYAKNEGNTLVPVNHLLSNGKKLGHWVNDQRKIYQKGKLNPIRQELLESVPEWTWDALKYKWEKIYCELEKYAKKNGNCSVPHDLMLDDGKKLVDFVNVQRQRREQLGEDRKLLLEALPGWTWDPEVSERQESFKDF